ncbi:Hypothetical Protein FCC1311_000412 [Hondaea fermentalgiana]|uniref:Uncharacterized protein n=1 Tax=Hondaea fermentalgiana TaxID=2315210 RepID=A0A2R5G702_9STRA|nr:Hypothetical Protein FCC1311_000412 [Hondaea fermentalgiana]|eukprot:GBG23821.1 Hypothetical Protein FCC1311_000412 [Hondaea fermentalgiana]
MKARELGFDLGFRNEKLPSYNALQDANLRQFFGCKNVQSHLYANGLIDGNGRVVNLDKNKSKLFIIEQEFKAAERAQALRRKEEEEMRHRVQQKRIEMLEKARRAERLQRIKEDREIRQQIMATSRSALSIPTPKPARRVPRDHESSTKSKSRKRSKSKSKSGMLSKMPSASSLQDNSQADSENSFFVTEIKESNQTE